MVTLVATFRTSAATTPNSVFGYQAVTNPDKSQWAKRADGSVKGMGFLGLLQRPDGNVSSEISIDAPASELGVKGNGDIEYPLMVPGLTKPELDYLMTHEPDQEKNPNFLRDMPRSILEKAADHARGRLSQGLSPFAGPQDMPPQGDLPSITAQSESGSRDYVNGTPVTSPKGAKYAMQVMPGTAGDPGFGVRPAQNDSPAEYDRVGRDYLDALHRRYKGDLAATWGAYNAGPGRVDSLIRQYGNDWWKHAPPETQNYIERNLAALGG